MSTEKFLIHHYKSIVVSVLILFFGVSVLNACNDSATFDEIAHIGAGYTYLTQHEMRLNPEHPPLLKDFIAFPLLALGLHFDSNQPFWIGGSGGAWDAGQWEAGKYLLYEAGNNPDRILFWSRMPIIILSVIFGLFLFKWGKELLGILGGLFVLVLYAADPNILGHNHYVTTDLGIAAFITFAFYYFLRFIKQPTWKNSLVAGFFLSLAQLAKFSSLIFLPIFVLLIILYPLIKKISRDDHLKDFKTVRLRIFFNYLLKSIAAFAFSLVVIWLVYALNTFNTDKTVIPQTVDFFFRADDPNVKVVYTRKILAAMNENALVRPMGEYLLGVAMVFRRVAGGNEHYFLGQYTSTASASYFPIVFFLKETLPFLLLLLFTLCYGIAKVTTTIWRALAKKNFGKTLHNYLQTRPMHYSALLFVLLYAYLSIGGNLNIGFRHLFPILPFLYLLIAQAVMHFLTKRPYRIQMQFKFLLAFLVFWMGLEAAFAYPGYVSYFNESIGGSKNGYQYVTDSNTDWGQDLKRLRQWINEHNRSTANRACLKQKQLLAQPAWCIPVDAMRVDYFGGGRPDRVLGETYVQWWDSMRPVEPGWYAISVNSLQGSIYNKHKSLDENYSWTLQYPPIDMIGNSILIYYIP